MIGRIIHHYRVIEKLGAGGMGVVYKAEDIKLGRKVALKFLPEHLTRNHRMLERLTREARVASTLNHPNICTIYSIEEFEGRPFIAMELLEGQTLKQRLEKGKIPIPDCLDIGTQIATALEAAHNTNVIHRDIKLANIFLSKWNYVKVLDFGLAKAYSESGDSIASTFEELTIPGSTVGTIAYMSPEQSRGEKLDGASDLFSLGVVLYEVATGIHPFLRSTAALTFEAILNREAVRPSRINPEVSPEFEHVLLTLLQKDRNSRYRSATDVRVDLTALKSDTQTSKTAQFQILQYRRRLRTFSIVGLMTILAVIVAYSVWPSRAPSLQNATFSQLTNELGEELFPDLSLDGKSFVYVSRDGGDWDIFLRRVNGKNTTNLTRDSDADDTQPAFSPDGESIAFRSERDGGGIFVMGATGESVKRITNFGYNPTWSPDGREIAIAEEGVADAPNARAGVSALWAVEVSTGRSRRITEGDAVQPAWSPHGDRIAFWTTKEGRRDIATVRSDGTAALAITNDASLDWSPTWSPDGRYIYFSSDRAGNSNLWRVQVDEKTGQTRSRPEPVTAGGGLAQRHHARFAADGRHIIYVEEVSGANIQQARFDPLEARILGDPMRITDVSRTICSPDPSPDGRWIAYQSCGSQEDIFVIRPDGTEIQITNDSYKDRIPRWSPDGLRLAFYSNRSGSFDIWLVNRDGSGLQQIKHETGVGILRAVWSPDGKRLASYQTDGKSFIEDLKGGSAPPTYMPSIRDSVENFVVWSWSPDGRWLSGDRSTRQPVAGIALFDTETQKYDILADAGTSPVWLNDSRRLLYERRGEIWLIDRITKQTRMIFSAHPYTVDNLGLLPRNNLHIYFTLLTKEADVWLMNISEK